jgi:hypothetical protein
MRTVTLAQVILFGIIVTTISRLALRLRGMGQEPIPQPLLVEIGPSGILSAAPKIESVLCIAMIGKNETPGEQMGGVKIPLFTFLFFQCSSKALQCSAVTPGCLGPTLKM